MNKQRLITTLCLAMAVLVGMTHVAAAGGGKETELTAQGEKIAAGYTKMLEDLKKEIVSQVPGVDAKVKADFTQRLTDLRNVPPSTINKMSVSRGKRLTRKVIVQYDPGNPAFAEGQKGVQLAARAVMKEVDAFLTDDKTYEKLAKFALLASAKPRRLAQFAQQGKEEKALIDDLLNDDKLVAQAMLLRGSGNYGQAMRSYRAIQKAAPRSREGSFQVWALAVSLRFCGKGYIYPGVSTEKSLVRYYLSYLKAYDEGVLDPAFSKLGGTGWNYRWVFPDSYTLEDIEWIRKVLRNYRPDHTRMEYRWRYCRIVKTDVPYMMGVDRNMRPDLKLSPIQKFFLEGGSCGPRSFVGQVCGYAFGIPTTRAPSPGHAALAHWTPDGWTTVLGPHFYFCKSVGDMRAMDFLLESQVTQDPVGYRQLKMCDWLGEALGEDAVVDHGSKGGFWRLMGHYKRRAVVQDKKMKDIGTTGAELAESNVSGEKEKIEQVEVPEKFRKITVAEDGTITIPVGACYKPESGELIRFMKTIDGDAIQAHYSLGWAGANSPELLRYTLDIPKAGKYEFTAHVCNVTVDRQFLLRVNRRTYLDVDLPYTKADWMDTKPVELDLKEGRNRFEYTHKPQNKGVSIKYFTLKPVT